MILRVDDKGRMTIPRDVLDELRIEPGDLLEARIEPGRLVLVPVAVVQRALALTESGAAKEAEADCDLRHGRYRSFDNLADLLADLDG